MKFGRKISHDLYNAWRPFYIDYTQLKRELKSRVTSHNWNDEDEAAFTSLLEEQLDKVYNFQREKTAELASRIKNTERAVKKLVAVDGHEHEETHEPERRATDAEGQTYEDDGAPDAGSDDEDGGSDSDDDDASLDREERFQLLEEEVADLVADVHDLALFSKLNFTGFMKILKKHDKQTGRALKATFSRSYLERRPFYKYNWDALIIKLSRSYDLVRTRGHPIAGDSSAGGSQSAFVRQTTKYWVHPDNLVQLKLAILRHLPVLVFNPDKEFEEKDAAITSIYFDNEDLELYLGRLEKTEGAQAIRLRWYGDVDNKQIFVERKTHREDWTGEKSVKARFPIKEDKVNAFLRGEYTMDEEFQALVTKGKKTQQEVDGMIQLANEVQYAVMTKKFQPVVRTFYNRTAFQLPGDARVRISLDTELTMVREDNWDGRTRTGDNWRRTDIGIDYPFSQVPAEDKELFRYGVLEVKLQTQFGQQPPQWILDLVNSHLVEAVPKFSKFIHGCATLLPHRVDLVPFWLPQMDVDILKPDTGLVRLSRPQHASSSNNASPGTSRVGSSGVHTPEVQLGADGLAYIEPVSEGEEEEEYAPLARARDEGAATRLSTVDAAEAIAFREKLLSERERTSSTNSGSSLAKKAQQKAQTAVGKIKDSKDTVGRRALAINPLAPASLFDEAFKSKLANGVQPLTNGNGVAHADGIGHGEYGPREDDAVDESDEDESAAVRALEGRAGADDRILVRDWRAPAGKRIAVPVRIEPKVYFATERTFLKWMHFAIYIGTIATALLNFVPTDDARGQISATLFTLAALLAIVYSAGVFVYRTRRIRARRASGMYYDKYGPTALCAVLAVALLTDLVLRLGQAVSEEEVGGTP